ncbi:hypothetical protein XENOCAPTIV_016670 [Xenoophorus captivus]|uniref:Uncharacterized protein n=1 Tax=Xenoophorus captivus TaxID=1517983 RepID=A0ABV0Q663_9TELE
MFPLGWRSIFPLKALEVMVQPFWPRMSRRVSLGDRSCYNWQCCPSPLLFHLAPLLPGMVLPESPPSAGGPDECEGLVGAEPGADGACPPCSGR